MCVWGGGGGGGDIASFSVVSLWMQEWYVCVEEKVPCLEWFLGVSLRVHYTYYRTIEDLYAELVREGIIVRYPKTRLSDYVGEFRYSGLP